MSAERARVIVNAVTVRRSLVVGCCLAWGLACGSRTALFVPEQEDAAPPVGDGGRVPDARTIPPDARTIDVTVPPIRDAAPEDAADVRDALPAIDVVAKPPPNNCPDAAATLVYLITVSGTLLSFYPPTATFSVIGSLACAAPPLDSGRANSPNSMAVDQAGVAYVGYRGGQLYRVGTAHGACSRTPFVSGQNGFPDTFGMGYASSDAGETLYVAALGDASRLATIDTSTFALDVVGPFQPPVVSDPELTGTGGGDLFAFFKLDAGSSAIGQIDRATAQVIGQATLTGVAHGVGWAFAFWGGDFYTFTSPNSTTLRGATSQVRRYRPSDGTIVEVATYPDLIVGAGVSTCAPQQ
ncbi:MAG: hypothetical protein JOZ69_13760 [Myxococcales bacterium]|nr:hypothetical protein [Myxococcales bacterium]